MEIKSVTIVGAGTMGNGIAHVFAQHGFAVTLNDLKQEFIDRGLKAITGNLDRQARKGSITEEQKNQTLSRICFTTDLKQSVESADLVIEAATENRSIKQDIFRTLDSAAPPGAILASNTSSISITEIAASTKRPG